MNTEEIIAAAAADMAGKDAEIARLREALEDALAVAEMFNRGDTSDIAFDKLDAARALLAEG